LEGVFSNVRTQDHNCNADVLQFGQKLSAAAEINATFERNPDLDRGHRRLNLQDAEGIDHVNPASWKGNVEVGMVNLEHEWKAGQEDANQLLTEYFGPAAHVDFPALFSSSKIDLLRPLGSYIGSKVEPGDERSEQAPVPLETTTEDDSNLTFEESAGMNIEDFLEDEDGEGDLPKVDPYLSIDGKKFHKSSLVTSKLTAKGARKATMRTL
jgi:hypothetical protein